MVSIPRRVLLFGVALILGCNIWYQQHQMKGYSAFDSVKIGLQQQQQQQQQQQPFQPTFLLGIPTVQSAYKRRQTIRDTYLSAYRDTSTPHRICPLSQYESTTACQVAYAFFLGANPNGSTILLDPNTTHPLIVSIINETSPEYEFDVIYLNIRENQMDGKMLTFFRYASELSQFDYIAKVDDDTVLFMPNFLDYIAKALPQQEYKSPQKARRRINDYDGINDDDDENNNNDITIATPLHVHGGLTMTKHSCNPNDKEDDHPCPLPLVGNVYMSGELTFVSRSIATFITNTTGGLSDARRKEITIASHEDVSFSNYVFAMDSTFTPLNISANRQEHSEQNPPSTNQVVVVDIPRDLVMRSKRHLATWKMVKNPYQSILWAHSTSSSGGYFKNLDHVRQIWSGYMDAKTTHFLLTPWDYY